MRKNKWYWVIGVMTAVALGITLDMYYHTARKQRGELLSLIAVIVSIFTLAATIFIALYIYNKGKNDAEQNEKMQKNIAKKLMGAVVVEAIRWLMTDVGEREVGVANRVREYLNRYEETMALVLTNRQLKILWQIVETVQKEISDEDGVSTYTAEEEREFLFRDWIKPIMGSEFQWRHKACGDIFQLLDREVYDLLHALGVYGTEKEYDDNVHQILDVWDRILFERVEGELDQDRIDVTETYNVYEDEDFKKMFSKVEDIRNATKIKWPEVNPDNQYVAIYDYKELIAYGVFDIDCDTYHNYGLKAGCKSTKTYKGYVQDGYYHGMGIEYYSNCSKKNEGFWVAGDLKAGVQHNSVVKCTQGSLEWNEDEGDFDGSPDCELELLYQINEDTFDGGLYMLEHDIVESGIDNYYVADYKFAGNKRGLFTKMVSLDVFLNACYPKELDHIKELQDYYNS